MVHAALDGNWESARKLHGAYHRLFCDLFLETNPVPVKTALALMGRLTAGFRLPLCEMSPAHQATLEASLRDSGLIA